MTSLPRQCNQTLPQRTLRFSQNAWESPHMKSKPWQLQMELPDMGLPQQNPASRNNMTIAKLNNLTKEKEQTNKRDRESLTLEISEPNNKQAVEHLGYRNAGFLNHQQPSLHLNNQLKLPKRKGGDRGRQKDTKHSLRQRNKKRQQVTQLQNLKQPIPRTLVISALKLTAAPRLTL